MTLTKMKTRTSLLMQRIMRSTITKTKILIISRKMMMIKTTMMKMSSMRIQRAKNSKTRMSTMRKVKRLKRSRW